MSSSFGLLHGFGFAAALSEIGLPQKELVTGLLFFNVGVEIGQAVFAIAVMLLMAGCKWALSFYKGRTPFGESLRIVVSYGVGSLASFWMLDRLM